MENQNKEQKYNNENIPENVEEIESLNDNEELELEDLEGINGGTCETNNGCCTHSSALQLQ